MSASFECADTVPSCDDPIFHIAINSFIMKIVEILVFWPLIFTMHCKCFVLSMLHAQKKHSYRRMKKSYPSKFKDKTFLSLDGKISSLDGKIPSLDGKKSSMDGIFICQKKISSFIFIHGSKVRMMMKDDGHGHSLYLLYIYKLW